MCLRRNRNVYLYTYWTCILVMKYVNLLIYLHYLSSNFASISIDSFSWNVIENLYSIGICLMYMSDLFNKRYIKLEKCEGEDCLRWITIIVSACISPRDLEVWTTLNALSIGLIVGGRRVWRNPARASGVWAL